MIELTGYRVRQPGSMHWNQVLSAVRIRPPGSGHLYHLGAYVPESRRQGVVLRGARRTDQPVALVVAAGLPFHLGAGGEEEDGIAPLLGRDHEQLCQREEGPGPPRRVRPDVGGDRAGVEAVDGDAGSLQAPRQLAAEEHVAQLGPVVGLDDEVALLVAEI